MNEISCNICQDLMPLVRDGIASEESREAVQRHTANCAACAALMGDETPPPAANGERAFRKLRQHSRLLAALGLLFCVFFSVEITATENMFYNILLMPFIGALGYGVFRGKVLYKLPLVIFLTHTAVEVVKKAQAAEALDMYTVVYMSVIYSLLAFVGALIAWLVAGAFSKTPDKDKKGRAIALIIAAVLTIGVGVFSNGLVGNPISQRLAENAAREHLKTHYAGTDYVLENVAYTFITHSYLAHITAPGSTDRYFTLWLDGLGHVRRDDYTSMVAEGGNTARRLDSAYRALSDAVWESDALPFETHLAFGDLEFLPRGQEIGWDGPIYGIDQTTLTPDALYDIPQLGAQAGHLTVYIDDETVTAERAAELLLEIKRLMDAGGVPFYAIDLTLQYPRPENGTRPEGSIDTKDFLCADIYPDGLADRVRASDAAVQAFYGIMDAEKQRGE